MENYMNVILTPTIISGPTPYAVKMDSSQVGCQNLQFVKGLKEWQTHQNTFLWKNHCKILQDPFNVLRVFVWGRNIVYETGKRFYIDRCIGVINDIVKTC